MPCCASSSAVSSYSQLISGCVLPAAYTRSSPTPPSRQVGMAQRSQALIANAWHHRADSLSSLVAAVGIGGAWAGIPVLDPLASLGIAVMIGKAGVETGWEAVRELADERLDDALLAEAEAIALGVPHVLSIRRLRARRHGPAVLLDCEIGVTPSLSVVAAHDAAAVLRSRIFAARPEVSEVVATAFPHCPAASEWQPVTAHGGPQPSPSSSSSSSSGGSGGAEGKAARIVGGGDGSGGGVSQSLIGVDGGGDDEPLRRLLLSATGAKAVTRLAVVVRPPLAQSSASAGIDVRASILFDLDVSLREALGALRRARKRVEGMRLGGGGGGRPALPVLTCDLQVERDPV